MTDKNHRNYCHHRKRILTDGERLEDWARVASLPQELVYAYMKPSNIKLHNLIGQYVRGEITREKFADLLEELPTEPE